MPQKKRLKKSEKISGILNRLEENYPHVKCALDHKSPFQLLIATILSAQCTDKKVNEVTPQLFKKYPTPQKMAKASIAEIEHEIRQIGLFRSKAKSLKQSSERLVEDFGSEVPGNVEDLLSLRGVARKTANVVLGEIFNQPDGVVVDTHVKRISYLLGLTKETDPKKIEQELNKLIPREEWVNFTHRVIHHGRQICVARRPQCLDCCLLDLCGRKGLKKLPQRPSGALSLDAKGELRPLKKSLKKAAKS